MVVFLLLSSSFVGVSTTLKQTSIKKLNGNTLYVGGDGPGNYTRIQDAINDSVNGDIIFVYSGTYEESITINKSINLVGENIKSTIITGSYGKNIVTITADWVNISCFTITRNFYWDGIYLCSSNNTIKYMDIKGNKIGIRLSNSSHNNFIYDNYFNLNWIKLEGSHNNIIQENYMRPFSGIALESQSNHNIITQNTIIEAYGGIEIEESSYNIITENYFAGIGWDSIVIWKNSKYNQVLNNTIYNCNDGLIRIQQSGYNQIIGNHLSYTTKGGILLFSSSGCNVSHNYFYDNGGGITACQDSRRNTIYQNTIDNIQGIGLSLPSSSMHKLENNSIIENTVSNCKTGLSLSHVKNNVFLRNNFINNSAEIVCEWDNTNIWDDGHLGNYWDSYKGYDCNGDGIGDRPKSIEGENNTDHCPLMVPYGPDTGVRITTPLDGYIYVRNIRVLPFFWSLILGNIKIKASAANYQNKDVEIEKVEFYVDGIHRWTDTEPPYSWRWRLSSHIKHKHTIKVIAYDNVGNSAVDEMKVWKFF